MPATPLPVPQTLPPRVPASSGPHAHPPPRTAGRWPPQLSLSPRSHQAQQSCFWAPGRWCRRGHRQPLRLPRPPLPSAVVGGAESTLQQRASRRGDGVFGQRRSAFPTLAEDQNASTLGREEWRSHWDRGSKAHSRGPPDPWWPHLPEQAPWGQCKVHASSGSDREHRHMLMELWLE